jgi:hypothetical protein
MPDSVNSASQAGLSRQHSTAEQYVGSDRAADSAVSASDNEDPESSVGPTYDPSDPEEKALRMLHECEEILEEMRRNPSNRPHVHFRDRPRESIRAEAREYERQIEDGEIELRDCSIARKFRRRLRLSLGIPGWRDLPNHGSRPQSQGPYQSSPVSQPAEPAYQPPPGPPPAPESRPQSRGSSRPSPGPRHVQPAVQPAAQLAGVSLPQINGQFDLTAMITQVTAGVMKSLRAEQGAPVPAPIAAPTARASTVDTISSQSSSQKLKKDDIGIFHPDNPRDHDKIGIIHDGKLTTYTDVYTFAERLESLRTNYGSQETDATDVTLLQLASGCLQGAALQWWVTELDHFQRQHCLRSLANFKGALERRFKPPYHQTLDLWNKGTYSIQTFKRKGVSSLHAYVQRQFRYAKALDIANNPRAAILMIWRSFDFDIQFLIGEPSESVSLSDFLRRIDDRAPLIEDHISKIQGPQGGYTSGFQQMFDRRSGRPFEPKGSQGYQGNSYRKDQPGARPTNQPTRERDSRDDRAHKSYGNSSTQPQYRNGGKSGQNNAHWVDPDDNNGHQPDDFVGHSREASPAPSETSTDSHTEAERDVANWCTPCNRAFATATDRTYHDQRNHSIPEATLRREEAQTSEVDLVKRRTCGHCKTILPSRNKLFQHLKEQHRGDRQPEASVVNMVTPSTTGKHPDDAKPVEPTDAIEPALTASALKLITEPPVEDSLDMGYLGSYTHKRIHVRPAPDGEDVEFCPDTGAARGVIDEAILQRFEHTITPRRCYVKGVNGKPVRSKGYATFTFYAEGLDRQGNPTMVRFTGNGWVVPDLQPNCLLGTAWLDPRGAVLDFGTKRITFASLDGFNMPFEAMTCVKPCVRRVTLDRAVTLLPGQIAWAKTSYKDLPRDRAFAFYATHPTAVDAIVDARSARVVKLQNPSTKVVKLSKKTRLGTISEAMDSGYFATTWESALTALTIATAAGSLISGGLPAMTSSAVAPVISPDHTMGPGVAMTVTSVLGTDSPVPAMSAEFDMTPAIRAIACESYTPLSKAPSPEISLTAADESNSQYPLTDAVFHVIQASLAHPDLSTNPADYPVVPDRDGPRLGDLRDNPSALGIKKPLQTEELVTDEGIHIYNLNRPLARRIQRLVKKYPGLWTDRGPIKVPLDQQMKIPLVDGWQHHKLNSRAYPLSRKDQEFLDQTFGLLHKQGRMNWFHDATPFAHPVFVVWRTVHGVDKGRMVIDLRPLNRVAVPDSYPLPLQAEVIQSIRGKLFISVIDATAFFHQFLVHPDYRDRFTIISHRGIEQSAVALMGYKNSPAYVQRFMDKLLSPHRTYCRAFIDDIVIFSDSADEHERHLDTIFALFDSRGISIAPKKSFLA